MLRLTEGLETELSDRLQRYLLGDLFGEGASDFESRDDMCVEKWGGIRIPKEFESNDRVRQFLEDLCAPESFAHPDICAARSAGKAKKRKIKCKCCCRSGGRRGYPCQFSTNRFGFSNFARRFERHWNLLLIPNSIWHEMGAGTSHGVLRQES